MPETNQQHSSVPPIEQRAHLLTPLDWSMEAHARAARLCGTTEGELALVEYRRYVLMHEYMQMMEGNLQHVKRTVADLREEINDLQQKRAN